MAEAVADRGSGGGGGGGGGEIAGYIIINAMNTFFFSLICLWKVPPG